MQQFAAANTSAFAGDKQYREARGNEGMSQSSINGRAAPLDAAIAEADTLLLTVPNQLGVAYNAHVLEAILTTVAPALGWR